jgi:uncharacterized membrane protein
MVIQMKGSTGLLVAAAIMLIVLIAVALAISIAIIALPAMSKILNIPLAFNIAHNPAILPFLVSITSSDLPILKG